MSSLRGAQVLCLLVALVLAVAQPAAADTVENGILAHNGNDTITLGGSLTVHYSITATSNDRQPGCNPADGTPATLHVQPSSPAVSASPASLTFTGCGLAQPVVLSASAPGNYRIDLAVADAGAGTYGVGGATFTLHVLAPVATDATPPSWSVPSGAGAEAAGPDGAVVAYAASASDPSGVASSSCSPPSGSLFPLGTTLVSCTATDGAGNVGTASFTVTVADTTPPALDVPAAASAEATGPDGAPVSWTASALDAVDGALAPACAPASGSTFPLGATLVTCAATDAAGNAATASFTVTVLDTTAPALALPGDLTVEATGPDGAAATWSASASDLVDGSLAPACAPASGSTFPLGATPVACAATDAAGNAASGAFTVTVVDTTPPALALPPDMTLEATGPGGAMTAYAASALDLVDGAVALACTHPSGALFPLGATVVTCSASDAAGNAATGAFTVTVQDTTPPTLAPMADLAADATSGAGATVTYAATAHDLVDGAIQATCAPASGSFFALGATTVTCTATDAAGNAAPPVSFTVRVALDCAGPLAPIKLDGKTTFRLGSTIPIKCMPQDGSAGVGDATIRLTMRHVNAAAPGTDVTPTSTSAADTGNVMRWDPTGQQYIYNLATKGLAKGTWEITMDLGGGATKTFRIGLR